MKLEVVVIPVSDVDRAKRFYSTLGWRLDADFATNDQCCTVHASQLAVLNHLRPRNHVGCAGLGIGLYLIVSDIKAAHAELVDRGVEVSELFHDVGGVFHHAGREGRLSGSHPPRRSYASFASFSDPDGNGWLLQEVTERLPGRVDANDTTFTSSTELASALRRAEAAHGEHEKRTGSGGSVGKHCTGALAEGGLRIVPIARLPEGAAMSCPGCAPITPSPSSGPPPYRRAA